VAGTDAPFATCSALADARLFAEQASSMAPLLPVGSRGRDLTVRTITIPLVDDNKVDGTASRLSSWHSMIANPLIVACNGIEALDSPPPGRHSP
jgi:hypothetical protein